MSEALLNPALNPILQAVGWALVHFLWQGALVAGGLAAGLALMKKRSASARYALGVGTLALLVVLPVVTAFRAYEPVAPAAKSSPSPALPRFAGEGAPAAPAQEPAPMSLRETVLPWMPSLLAVWLLGVALLSVWHLSGWIQVRRMTRRATRPVDDGWELALIRLRRRLGIEHAVMLLESAAVPVPAVIGWLRPVILVPASAFAGLTPEQLEAILAHELAHVRRHDYLINLLQAVVETLLFYHPAVWWVSSQVRQERESCCDDLAVSVCGDRLGYARALAALEGLRTPHLALGADGGSLLRRIRRLVGAPEGIPETAGGAPVAWVAGALALAVLLGGAAFHDGARAGLPFEVRVMAEPVTKLAMKADAPFAAAQKEPASSRQSGDSQGRRGQWTAERTEDGIQLQMTDRHDGNRSQHSHNYDLSELVGLSTGSNVRFEMPRAAGTFHFQGRYDGELGEGTFTFQGNPSYIQEMSRIGYQVEQDDLFKLALFDISPAYVSELKAAGYDDLSLDKLVEFRIFEVTPEYIRDMAGLGYRDVPADKLVAFRIHGVNPDEVRELAKVGLRDLSADRLIEFRIHGVKPELVRAMADAGYENLSASKLVELKIHGATPEFARDMAELGYRDVSLDRLVEFRIHGVTPEFIREIAGAGHEGVPAEDLVSMRIHGVDAEYIRKAEARAGHKLEIEDIIDRKIMGRHD
ncbi:MAG TPA: M56 family metallopeptidase [Thermoanaerobaculia bacterium]|nr:M56 family metallopeptidase [Thermoanaerobaculia bacterium]